MKIRKPVKSFGKKHRVVLESNGINSTKVFIDGVDLSNAITEVKFEHKGGQLPILKVELRNCDVSIISPQVPQLPEVFRSYYKPC